MPAPIYLYSFADFGIPAGYVPVAGDTFTTSETAAPDLINLFDNDLFLDGPGVDPTTGAPTLDFDQVLTTNLMLDGVQVGGPGDLVYPVSEGVVFLTDAGVTIQGYLLIVSNFAAGTGGIVGLVTSLPVSPNTPYTFTGMGGMAPVLYSDLACFTRDTMIECESGPVAVQDIAVGDLVVTRTNGLQAVRWAGGRTVVGAGDMAPICVKAGALGNVVDMRFSPMHRVLIRGARAEVLFGAPEVLAHAAHLCDGDRIYRAPCGAVEYFHILFDHHEIIRAHGCWSESFAPSTAALEAVDAQTRAEVLKLFPELDQDWRDALPTLSAAEAQLAI